MEMWLAGAVFLAGFVCITAGRFIGVAGLVAAATALGALLQVRLGQPPARIGFEVGMASVAFVASVRLGRSARWRRVLIDSYRVRVLSLTVLTLGVVLRALTILGPDPAAGTLPLVAVQIGELTRYLVVAGVVIGVSELSRGLPTSAGRDKTRRADRRFLALLVALLGLAFVTLVGVHDLGPVALVAAGVTIALVHLHGLRSPGVLAGLCVVVLAAVALSSLPVVRSRLDHVLQPDPQLSSALVAANSGGLIGPGPGGSPLVEGVPAIGSDFALAALTADFGALVVLPLLVMLLGCYVGLMRAGAGRVAPVGPLCAALAGMLLVQAAWNALGTSAVVPLTGLNQPFLGLSGSSVLTSSAVLGLVLGLLEPAGGHAPQASVLPGARAVRVMSSTGMAVASVLLIAAVGLGVILPRPIGNREQTRMPRGVVWTVDGQIIAVDGRRARLYPAGDRYDDLGRDRWGFADRGLGAVEADALTCGGRLHLTDWLSSLWHTVCKPADVVSTVDSRVQQTLADALDGRTGEAAVLDARTGALLGLYSTGHSAEFEGSPARFRQGPPGSTMKLVTAAASLLNQIDFARAPATEFVGADGQRVFNDYRLSCPGIDIQTALAHSCNSVFGWAANAVGAPALRRVADTYFGADQNLRLQGGDADGLSTGLPEHGSVGSGALARTGIGQESARSSVLGIALATAVIANSDRVAPTWWPHLTAAICPDRSGVPVLSRHGDALGPALPSWASQMIYGGMREAVTEGTARTVAHASASAHAELAAKTGTAQTVAGHIDSWITVIIDHRTVLTLVIHDASGEAAAGQAAGRVLAALPRTAALPNCAQPTRPRALDVHDTAVRWQPEG
jgi:hypothetical protein